MVYQTMPDYMRVPLFDMPQDAQMWALYLFSALAVLTYLLAMYRCIAERSPNPLLYCLGGTVTCFLEPLLTRLLDATHAQNGQQLAYESLGQRVPWHAAISYTFYFGLAYLSLVPAFRERRYTARTIWLMLFGVTASAWIYEVPLIRVGLWSYFGDQPYQPFGLQPVYWSFASMAMLITPTALIARYEALLQGWSRIMIVALAPIGAIAGAAGACWPVWFALNSPYGHGVKVFAATLTILFALFIAWLAIPLVARQKQESPQALLLQAGA
ncbi:hypothetical protein [Paraburkholderia unamae]|uniref:Uncharacterized protein n=1 Tax=Paraburkholderia unamae TaxID=219649 RepID=A0ABX5KI11_9BURK|nr:hypothetical protein [Paraburkholderia unamae]PVX75698.1 hypothetical protein C7402_117110 [Paraburkholderia unamae]